MTSRPTLVAGVHADVLARPTALDVDLVALTLDLDVGVASAGYVCLAVLDGDGHASSAVWLVDHPLHDAAGHVHHG